MPETTLHDRLKALRGDLSLRAFARKLNVDPATIKGWETFSTPYRGTLEHIAKTCHVDIEWLLTGKGETPEQVPPCEPSSKVEETPGEMEYRTTPSTQAGQDILSLVTDGMSCAQLAAAINRVLSSNGIGTEQRNRAATHLNEILRQRLNEQARAAARKN